MAIVGVGVDIVDVFRMKQALESGKVGERLKRRVFTAAERRYCEQRGDQAVESYAARFAAKEAVKKALGAHATLGFAWPEIEVVRAPSGAPGIVLHGRTKAKAERAGAGEIHVSMTHMDQVAVAHAVVEKH